MLDDHQHPKPVAHMALFRREEGWVMGNLLLTTYRGVYTPRSKCNLFID